MMYCWLWAPAALAALAAAAEVVTTTRQFEFDIVFPHNETYKPADTMPIVFAIQNPSVAASIGDFMVFWTISQVQGWDTIRSSMDFGHFNVFSNQTSTDATQFLVAFTNITDWIPRGIPTPPATEYTPGPHDRYLLQWNIVWTSLFPTCTKSESSVFAQLPSEGALAFNIQTVWGKGGWQGEIHDVQEAIPQCPEFGGLIQIGPPPNATKPTCPRFEILEDMEGSPCAVTVDPPAASSIWSRVSSSVSSSMSRYHPTPTTTAAVESSTSSGGVGPARTMQTALAAACVLCGLAL
ncbi:hypothetical protein F5144DRAFT_6701 [Chaetomium tenue]|uniref:Uncharacterized protein n=1 Tax=Chaetomium tenue TaxID=1854479 RepID=A0ACB7PPC8_9PEZI|nr:hypothetical protein F5144DRAFT_6701 [Chaetomium globosum]